TESMAGIEATVIGSTIRSTAAGLLTATEARPTGSGVRLGATRCRTGRPMPARMWPGSSLRAVWGIAARARAQVIGTWATAVGAQATWAEAVAGATAWVTSESQIVQARPTAA